MKIKQGISLIVLVITIIVMIILASVIVITLTNNGIINRASGAVEESNLDTVTTLAQMLWSEAYLNTDKSRESLEAYVIEKLEKIAESDKTLNLDDYVISVTPNGVIVGRNWVSETVDTVPIPKGFVASQVDGENTKNGGLVIYEGTEPVTDKNVEQARLERNQYVWVPIPKDSFKTKFKRTTFSKPGAEGGYQLVHNALGTADKYWEVALDEYNMPLWEENLSTNFMSAQTLTEVQELYASVRKYEGFYIARYETGLDEARTKENHISRGIETKVYSAMGKYPYNFVRWSKSAGNDLGGAVQVSRSIYPAHKNAENYDKYGVVSTLTYGVQWDATLQWLLDTGNVENVLRGLDHGNFINRKIEAGELNAGAEYSIVDVGSMSGFINVDNTSTKEASTAWLLTTGALKSAKVNNIYDMAGNLFELTMEGNGLQGRTIRGSSFETGRDILEDEGAISPITTSFAYRTWFEYTAMHLRRDIGFRPALYIKIGS